MPRVRLTDRGLKNLKADRPQEDYWDELLPGFGVRVTSAGVRTFFVRYRLHGAQRRMTLGRYPALSLAAARERARAALAAVAAGEDPALARGEARRADNTFAALAREVLAAKARTTRPATQRERARIVEAELLPVWGNRPAGSITRRDVVELVERIAARGAAVMANRVLATVKVLYNAALDREFPGVDYNPAARIKPLPEGRRDRYLSREEIALLWRATAAEPPVSRAVFRLALLTAQRIGSVLRLRWQDVDFAGELWRIPAEHFKGKRPHWVPLSREAMHVLAEVRELTGASPFAFPGRSDGQRPHMTSYRKALARIRARMGGASWTVHDLRTTFRTWAVRSDKPAHPHDPVGLGIEPAIADLILGHKERSIGFEHYTAEPEAYRLAERRIALQRWGRFVLAAAAVFSSKCVPAHEGS